MRLQPPVYYSSSVSMMKDVDAAGLKIRKGDQIYIGMGPLCNNPDQWQSPERFLPERFDSKNPLSLTPKGEKRNPFSFSCFLGGMRICLGKTFIEEVSKVTLPNLMRKFDFELEDQNLTIPFNNMQSVQEPVVGIIFKKKI